MKPFLGDRFTVVLSNLVEPDSDVRTGGGSDATAAIQAVLDRAEEQGGLTLVVDGAYRVRTLVVGSHTHIFCPNRNCGFFLADGTSGALFCNRHCGLDEIRDCDIRIEGGTYNLNAAHQEHHRELPAVLTPDMAESYEYYSFGFRFFGVEHLVLTDLLVMNQRTYAMAVGNFRHVRVEGVEIRLDQELFAQNQDGMHFFGPGRFLTVRDVGGRAGDDFLALAADEIDGKSSLEDVLVDGVHLDDSDQGIRLLSHGAGRLDRIAIRNVTGTYKSYGFFLNPWILPDYPEGLRHGNFGSISFDGVDLKQCGKKYDYTKPCLFRLGGRFESVRLRNIRFENADDPSDFVQIGGDYIFFDERGGDCLTDIGRLELDNVELTGPALDAAIRIKSASVGTLRLHNFVTEKPLVEMEGGAVRELRLEHVGEGAALVDPDGGIARVVRE